MWTRLTVRNRAEETMKYFALHKKFSYLMVLRTVHLICLLANNNREPYLYQDYNAGKCKLLNQMTFLPPPKRLKVFFMEVIGQLCNE